METAFLQRPGLPDLAYNRLPGRNPDLPALLFLGGFRSDRHGTKARHLEQFCAARGQEYVRFDYSGHGDSGGSFDKGTLESWRDDALAVFDRLVDGPAVLLAGSSMGGWIGLLLALARPERVRGFVGIAAAPDFTRVMTARFTAEMRRDYEARGFVRVPNAYSPDPYLMTQDLIESGNRICLLDQTHRLKIPLYLLHGKRDVEVDWAMPGRIQGCFPEAAVTIHLVEDGDHSLSRPEDLALIERAIISVCT